jgi:hypothetical protein
MGVSRATQLFSKSQRRRILLVLQSTQISRSLQHLVKPAGLLRRDGELRQQLWPFPHGPLPSNRFGITPKPMPQNLGIYPSEGTLIDTKCRGAQRIIPFADPISNRRPEGRCGEALLAGAAAGCDGISILCSKGGGPTAIHEIIHQLGIGGQEGHGSPSGGHKKDLTERAEKCIAELGRW